MPPHILPVLGKQATPGPILPSGQQVLAQPQLAVPVGWIIDLYWGTTGAK